MLLIRSLVCAVLMTAVLSLPAAEPMGPKPPASGAPSIRLGSGTVVFYPVPDQKDVPILFPGNEVPDPIPLAKTPQAGYPLTVTFAPRMPITAAKGRLLDDKKQEVPTWFSSPADPANPNFKSSQQNSLCLFPIAPLERATTYTVQMECKVGGARWQRAYSFTTAAENAPTDEVARVLERWNQYRKAAGVAPVALDEEQTKACQSHARYLARNLPTHPKLNLREQDPELPGSTPEGRKAAPNTVTLRGMADMGAIEFMVGVFANRAAALSPGLKKVALGVTNDPASGQLWVLDTRTFSGPFIPPAPTPFPAPGQKDVPLAYPGGSSLHPVPDEKARDQAGYAITALCWSRGEVSDVNAKLRKKGGDEVECWLSTPAKPALESVSQNSIMLVPKTHLEPSTTYETSMSARVDGKPWRSTWTFTTQAADDKVGDRAVIAKKSLDILNAYRATCGLPLARLDPVLSAACEKHCLYLRKHLGHPSTDGLGMHNEDPKFEGYTPDGAKAGKEGVITITNQALAAVPAWMDTLYHRIPLIDPRVQKVGFGYVPLADGRWICVMHARP